MSRPTPQTLDAAWRLIDQARSVVVAMHINPDGDALGSAMALAEALQGLGKDVHLVSPQQPPDIYEFLRLSHWLEDNTPRERPDLAVLVDCDRPDRVGDLEEMVKGAHASLVLDHHPPTSDFGDVRVTQQDAAATAEVVYHLLDHRGLDISPDMAEALLTGVMTDTGGFRFRNTTADSFEIAAQLSGAGASPADIAEQVYDRRSFAGLRLLSRALASLRLSPSGKVVWSRLSAEDFLETGAKPEETEGFVNLVHSLQGADVAVMMREEAPGSVRVSLRSRANASVNRIAEALGGGGHQLAAACVLETSLERAETLVLDELKKWTEF